MTAAASPTRPPTGDHDGRNAARDDQESPIRVHQEGTTVVIAVGGHLDLSTGELLLSAANAAVDGTGATRLDIDLRALDEFDDAGASALVSCRALGNRLAEGLHYRTGRGPGREALLAAYTDIDVDSDGE
jgi:hypothetical protein